MCPNLMAQPARILVTPPGPSRKGGLRTLLMDSGVPWRYDLELNEIRRSA
jgi:hypothetical protein